MNHLSRRFGMAKLIRSSRFGFGFSLFAVSCMAAPQNEFRGENGRALFFKQIKTICSQAPTTDRFENPASAKLHALAQAALSNAVRTSSEKTIRFAPLQEALAELRGGKGEVSDDLDFVEWHVVNGLWHDIGSCNYEAATRCFQTAMKLARAQLKKSAWETRSIMRGGSIEHQLLFALLGVGRLLLARKRTKQGNEFFLSEHAAWPDRREAGVLLSLMLQTYPAAEAYEALRDFIHSEPISTFFTPLCNSEESKLLLVAQSFTDFVLQKDNIRGPSNGLLIKEPRPVYSRLVDLEGKTAGASPALLCWALLLLELSDPRQADVSNPALGFILKVYQNNPFKVWFQKHVMTMYVLDVMNRDSAQKITAKDQTILASPQLLFTEFGPSLSAIEVCAHSPVVDQMLPFLLRRGAKLDTLQLKPSLLIYLQNRCGPHVIRQLVEAGAKVMHKSDLSCPVRYALKTCLWPQAEILLRAAASQIRSASESTQMSLVRGFDKAPTPNSACHACVDLLLQILTSDAAKTMLRKTCARTLADIDAVGESTATTPSSLAQASQPTPTPSIPDRSPTETTSSAPNVVRPKKACARCGVSGKLLKCGRCRGVSYCSQDCQRADWTRHKLECNQGSAT